MSLFDEEFEESLLDLRDVLCDERIAKYCIKNGITWSDSAMVGSPIEVLGLAKDLIEFWFSEELGVLLLELPEPNFYKYYFLNVDNENSDYDVISTDNAFVIKNIAYKCTRKEAERFPQFRWVALSDL
ncbi:hypothetical protein [Streptococcus uberis]|uniref:hypothetical protein n=1 Tax=Streptococcus uberis TaxID=1349 RepID=UPI003D7848A7